jgi:carboxylesterase
MLPTSLNLFQDELHQPFLWKGGRPAALFVHGFPGTPAEIRPLAQAFHEAGWTAQGILLPGFGPQIETLPQRRYTEWVDAVRKALSALQREHHPAIVAGFSMGGAVSLLAAAQQPPDALILLAPYWQTAMPGLPGGAALQRMLWPLFRPLLRKARPFKQIDFTDPRVRQGVMDFAPGLDLDDPQVQAAIRDFSVPINLFDQLQAVGRAAYQVARQVACPTLIIQGRRDEVVKAALTRRLASRLPALADYQEVDSTHELLKPDGLAWDAVCSAALEFAQKAAAG